MPSRSSLTMPASGSTTFFSIKKCGDLDCSMCGKPILDEATLKDIHHFPDPMKAASGDHYKSLDELWGTETKEKDRPSLQKTQQKPHAEMTADREGNRLSIAAATVRDFIECSDCNKPRCTYSNRKLTSEEAAMLHTVKT